MSDHINQVAGELPPLPAPHRAKTQSYTVEQVEEIRCAAYHAGRQSLSTSSSAFVTMANRLRKKRDAEIADLRAQLAQQGQGEPVGVVIGEGAPASRAVKFYDRRARVGDKLYLAAPASAQPARYITEDTAQAYMEETLWAFIECAGNFPSVKTDSRIWPHVMVYAAQQPAARVAVPDEDRADEIVTALYRRFKDWSKRGFGPDDVTWCEVKADVLNLIATVTEPAAPAEKVDIETLREQSDAWFAVANVLHEVSPGWQSNGRTGLDAAVATIRSLGAPTAQQAAPPAMLEWARNNGNLVNGKLSNEEKHARAGDQGAAQNEGHDAGAVSAGSGAGAHQHHEHREMQPGADGRDGIEDGGSTGLSDRGEVRAPVVAPTKKSIHPVEKFAANRWRNP